MNNLFTGILVALLLLTAGTAYAQNEVLDQLSLPDSLPALDTASARTLRLQAADLSRLARLLRREADGQARRAAAERRKADQSAKSAKRDTSLSADSLTAIQNNAVLLRDKEKQSAERRKRADKIADLAGRLESADSLQLLASLPRMLKLMQELKSDLTADAPLLSPPPVRVEEPVGQPAVADTASSSAPPPPVKPQAPPKQYKVYDPAVDVVLNPPLPPCEMAVNTRDEFSGEVRRELRTEPLFVSYPLGMQNQPPPRPLAIRCEAGLGAQGPNLSLHLTLRVYKGNTRRNYGGLPRNGSAIFKLLDGSTVTLYNIRPDDGVSEPNLPYTTFHAQYLLDKTVQKQLRKSGLDKLRLSWSAGYEDYEIINVDLIQRQLNCF